MAELASGAVSSLLGVIRNEALLLGRVRHDVQFIQEEMESMQSFLTHLSKKAPAGGEHDEQIRTWMNQVRLLAQDSNNCIDLYLYRGNPEIHLARGGLRRYIAWLPWFVHKMVAQHRAAIQLRALRERARDIGERRLRYGVEVPAKGAGPEHSPLGAGLTPAAALSSAVHAAASSAASGDEEEDNDDQLVVATKTTNHSGRRGAFFEPPTPEDNVKAKLAEWIEDVAQRSTAEKKSIQSIAIVAPDEQDTCAIADVARKMWGEHGTHSVLVDIPAVHFYSELLRTKDVLYYILRELQSVPLPSQQDKKDINSKKWVLIDEITKDIEGMKVGKKISEIMKTVEQMKGSQWQLDLEHDNRDLLGLLESSKDEPLGVILRALCVLKHKPADGVPLAIKHEQEKKQATPSERKKASHEDIIKGTAKKLKEHMEQNRDDKQKPSAEPILLDQAHYEHILRKLFPEASTQPLQIREQDSKQATAVTATSTISAFIEDLVNEMIHKVIKELQENRSVTEPGTAEKQDVKSVKEPDRAAGKKDCIPDSLIEEIIYMFWEIEWMMEEQIKIKRIMDKINDCLKSRDGQILVILKLDNDYVSGWTELRNAFSLMGRIAGVLLLNTTINADRAKQYCCPEREPIDYSLLGLYHDTALELTKKHMIEDSPRIFLDILGECKQQEFCMKIFVHALNANPKRSKEELIKLHTTLQQVPDDSLEKIANKMLKFSYSDLPNEYKSCLLYLAIFPRRQRIRRSTLIGRWVVEGLITKEDWASSVRRANRCFDALINRWLIYAADIGATGKIKSCVIGDLVHAFITRIARKRRIVETRLSHHLALRFSIFNDLRLRGSDKIDKFFDKLYEESSRVSLIKVLDLEGCQCFRGKNQSYLRDICSKMLLLKYLSLRGTDVTHLPTEINNLRELEVLDIRETNVPPSATVNLLLLKLKRLLAGRIVLSSGASSTELSSVEIPEKVEKMVNMEVLSNVKARKRRDLKDIGKLWQLRKLGVVIENKEPHLRNFLRAISDLHECLKSLSITLPSTEDSKVFTSWVLEHYKNTPKLLESLSISGTTQTVQLLQLFTRDSDQLQLDKVTLSGTKLRKADLKVLASLPKLACLRLRDKAYIDSDLTFINGEFINLKCFLIEGSNIIVLNLGGAHKLEKIILCSTDGLLSVCGVEDLPELKEVELKNINKLSLFEKAKNISKVTLCHTILCQEELEILAKIPNMRNLVLKEISYVQSQHIFYEHDFPRLKLLVIEFSAITNIVFASQSATNLERIIWFYTKGTLSGIDNLPKLKELEFNGDFVPDLVKEALKRNDNKPKLIHNKPENQHQEAGNIPEKEDSHRFPLFWKRED
ncbi:uncharacterized protein [Triticum aestivum]|uniref:uncharacterized protein n=1 Tax=Triticum aestivum TaxID=4565 RepID=UPI001D011128|nr:uncharacterized protein LOC123152661 [Triticum aestivum]